MYSRRRSGTALPALLLAVLVLLRATTGSASPIELHLSLEWHVAHAVDIAVVRLIDRQPVAFEYDGRSEVCGHRYRAQILESVKGQEIGTFEFFEAGPGASAKPNKEYLVMVFERDLAFLGSEAAPRRPRLEGVHEARSECYLTAGSRIVLNSPRTTIPFDRSGQKHPEGKELRFDPNDVSALEIGSYSLSFVQNHVQPDGETAKLADWEDTRSVIEQLMAFSRFFGRCTCPTD